MAHIGAELLPKNFFRNERRFAEPESWEAVLAYVLLRELSARSRALDVLGHEPVCVAATGFFYLGRSGSRAGARWPLPERSWSIMWLMYSGDLVLRATKAYTTGTT